MSDAGRRLRNAEEVIRRLSAAIRASQFYVEGHPLSGKALETLGESIALFLAEQSSLAIGFIEEEIVVGDLALPKFSEQYADLSKRVKGMGIERIAFERGITHDELTLLVRTLAQYDKRIDMQAPPPVSDLMALQHIRVGRISLDERVSTSAADVATVRRLYTDAVNIAQRLWETAEHEGKPDPDEASTLVDNLAQAVAQNRTALVALTALKSYDNYTFTHMVNVSILTMAQARALGIDGTALRELGLAALMHDIGKVRTPTEILNKPEKLTDAEFSILRMHVVDGAEILRRTPDMPPIGAVVAFEHHLRLDGTGYPLGVKRSTLNLGTMLCSIADVYDAMRSQRVYQEAFPTDRILAVLKRNDGMQFDQNLVRRFSQLMGIYPPGTLVKLDTGEMAVVLRVYAPDPFRPKVRVMYGDSGEKLQRPYDANLWEATEETGGPRSVLNPVDPSIIGIDPLTYL